MKELFKKVTEGQNLTREEAAKAMDMMLEGTASPGVGVGIFDGTSHERRNGRRDCRLYGNDEVKGRQRQA